MGKHNVTAKPTPTPGRVADLENIALEMVGTHEGISGDAQRAADSARAAVRELAQLALLTTDMADYISHYSDSDSNDLLARYHTLREERPCSE
jgi:hypothetical protein